MFHSFPLFHTYVFCFNNAIRRVYLMVQAWFKVTLSLNTVPCITGLQLHFWLQLPCPQIKSIQCPLDSRPGRSKISDPLVQAEKFGSRDDTLFLNNRPEHLTALNTEAVRRFKTLVQYTRR